MSRRNTQPVLVTGLPRSGTTWLARELTRGHGLALAGREPMNPRATQFALGGTLTAWSRLGDTATTSQRRTLRRVYRGLEPRVYSRYGVRQWSAILPTTRLVVKDPFALLSLPLLTEVTGARPIILFRHPGALLASYRRMGWTPAVEEIATLRLPPSPASDSAQPAPDRDADGVSAMAWFWSTCYDRVLDDLGSVPAALVVDHAELTRGGDEALRRLMTLCEVSAVHLRGEPRANPRALRRSGRGEGEKPVLHSFERTAQDVSEAWRASMPAADVRRLEALTGTTLAGLRERRVRLDGTGWDTDVSTGMEMR